MNGIIYKITNQINNKMYIGQTITSLSARWTKHKQMAQKTNRGLYEAIQKYGIENFKIEEIVRCKREELNDLEIFYISKYNTFYDGYNLTVGGDNAPTNGLDLNEEEVIEKYKELKYITETAIFFNCCVTTIKNILEKNDIQIKDYYSPKGKNNFKNNYYDASKKVLIVELNLTFDSILQCGQWLIDNGYSKASTPIYAQKSISRVLNGDRATYCKLHFEYS